jgi:hypothetical protein
LSIARPSFRKRVGGEKSIEVTEALDLLSTLFSCPVWFVIRDQSNWLKPLCFI